MLPSTVFPTVINHLLAQEPWASAKLAMHAGKVACFDAGMLTVRLRVARDGLVEPADGDAQPNVTIQAKMADLPLIARNRDRAFSYVKIQGDADFANTISQLSETLRWDAEEDLSKWIGDIAAVRVVSTARAATEAMQSAHRKATENLAEYFLEESPMLMRPQHVADFAKEVARLRDDVERIAKRIDKLNGSAK